MIFPFSLYDGEEILNGITAEIEYIIPNLEIKNYSYIEMPYFKNNSDGSFQICNPFIDFKISNFSFCDIENIKEIYFTLLTQYPYNTDDSVLIEEKAKDNGIKPTFSDNNYLVLKEIPEKSYGKLTNFENDIYYNETIWTTFANKMSSAKNTLFNITDLVKKQLKEKSNVICFRIFRLDEIKDLSTGEKLMDYYVQTPFLFNKNLLRHYNSSKKEYFSIIKGVVEIPDFDTSKNLFEEYDGEIVKIYHKIPELKSLVEFPVCEFNDNNLKLDLKYILNNNELLSTLHYYIYKYDNKIRIIDAYGNYYDYLKLDSSYLWKKFNIKISNEVGYFNFNDNSYITIEENNYTLCINKTTFYKFSYNSYFLYNVSEIYYGDVLVYSISYNDKLVTNIKNMTLNYYENLLNGDYIDDSLLEFKIEFKNSKLFKKFIFDEDNKLVNVIDGINEIYGLQEYSVINNLNLMYQDNSLLKIYDSKTKKGIYIKKENDSIEIYKYTKENLDNCYHKVSIIMEDDTVKIVYPDNRTKTIYFDEYKSPFLTVNSHETIYNDNIYNNINKANYLLNKNNFNLKEKCLINSFMESFESNNLISCSRFNESLEPWITEYTGEPSELIVSDDYLNKILGENAFVASNQTCYLSQTVNEEFNQGDLYRLEFWIKAEKNTIFSLILANEKTENFDLVSETLLVSKNYVPYVFYFENPCNFNNAYLFIRPIEDVKLYIKNVKLHKISSKTYDDGVKSNSLKKIDNNKRLCLSKKGLDILEYFYNNKNLVTKIKNHFSGEETQFEYDELNNIVKETKIYPLLEAECITYEYYPNGLLKKVIDNNNQETIYNYDYNNNVVEIVNSNGIANRYEYNDINELSVLITEINDSFKKTTYTYVNNVLNSMNLNDNESYHYLFNNYLLNSGYEYNTNNYQHEIENISYVSSTDKQLNKITSYATPDITIVDSEEVVTETGINFKYKDSKLDQIKINNKYTIDYTYLNDKVSELDYSYLNGKNTKQFTNEPFENEEILSHTYNDENDNTFDIKYFKNGKNKYFSCSDNTFKQKYSYSNPLESSIMMEIEKYNSCNINDYMLGSMTLPLFSEYSANNNVLSEFDSLLHSDVLLFNNKSHFIDIDLAKINKYRIQNKFYGNSLFKFEDNSVENKLDLMLLFKPQADNIELFTIKLNNGLSFKFNVDQNLQMNLFAESFGNRLLNSFDIELDKWHLLRVAIKLVNNNFYYYISIDGVECANYLNENTDNESNLIFEKIILGNYNHDEEIELPNLNIGYFSINTIIDYDNGVKTATDVFIDNLVNILKNPCYASNINITTYFKNYDIIDFNNNLTSLNGLAPEYVNNSVGYVENYLNGLFEYDYILKKNVLNRKFIKKYDGIKSNHSICYKIDPNILKNFEIKFRLENDEFGGNRYLLSYSTANSIFILYVLNNIIYVEFETVEEGFQSYVLGEVNANSWNEFSFKICEGILYYKNNGITNSVEIFEPYLEQDGLLYIGSSGESNFFEGYIEYIKFSSDSSVDLDSNDTVYYQKNYLTNNLILGEKILSGTKEIAKEYQILDSNFNNNIPNVEVNYDNTVSYYKYNKDGLLVGISLYDDNNNNISTKYFYYDEYNQIIKEECYDNLKIFNNYKTQYEYDLYGNILKKTKYSIENDFIFEYEYFYDSNIPNRLLSVIKKMPDGSSNIEYNFSYFEEFVKAIQVINKNGIEYKVKYLNNLISSIGNNKYYYDDQGLRIKKITEQNDEYTYYYDENRLVYMTFNINGVSQHYISYLYDESNQLFGLHFDGKPYFYNKDLMGNINSIVDINGKTMVKYYYNTFCEPVIITLDETDEDYNLSLALSKCNVFLYKGYIYDVETNLFLVTSRYYSPELGRFIQPADVSSLNPSSSNGLNLYSYANNNPISIANSGFDVSGTTGSGMVNSIEKTHNLTGNNISESARRISLPTVPWLVENATTMYGAVSSLISGVPIFNFYWIYRRRINQEFKLYGISKWKTSLQLSNVSFKMGALDGALIGVNVLIDMYDSYQRGVSTEGILLGGTLTAASGVLMFYTNKSIMWATTTIGTAICPGLGTAIGFGVGLIGSILLDIWLGNKIEDWIDNNIK